MDVFPLTHISDFTQRERERVENEKEQAENDIMWYDRNFSPHIGSAHSDGGTHPSEGFYERGDGKSFDRRRRAESVRIFQSAFTLTSLQQIRKSYYIYV